MALGKRQPSRTQRLLNLGFALGLAGLGVTAHASKDGLQPGPAPLPNTATVTVPVSPALAPYVRDGRLALDDAWLRGAFPGASPAQLQAWAAVRDYREACGKAPLPEALRAEAARLSVLESETRWRSQYVSPLCWDADVAVYQVKGFATWDAFQATRSAAQPYIQTYLFAVRQATDAVSIDQGSLTDRLDAVIVPDQAVRAALFWGMGDAVPDAPPLPPGVQPLVQSALGRAMGDYDRRNTAWLGTVLAHNGWPRASQVGARAAMNAFLLVQHADRDPLFQLAVLRYVEPLVKQGDMRPQDYALLQDRVTMMLTGTQRYGSQMVCKNGHLEPGPLTDAATVDAARAQMNLEPMAAYQARMNQMAGSCQE